MFFRMVKKDLQESRGLNVIIFVFMIVVSALAAASGFLLYVNVNGRHFVRRRSLMKSGGRTVSVSSHPWGYISAGCGKRLKMIRGSRSGSNGDGKSIFLNMEKSEEGHFISVTNSGEPLPDKELPFVFNSLWRGSNSGSVNGSGIGLYEARLIARKLGGDLRMKAGENETEVILFLPE